MLHWLALQRQRPPVLQCQAPFALYYTHFQLKINIFRQNHHTQHTYTPTHPHNHTRTTHIHTHTHTQHTQHTHTHNAHTNNSFSVFASSIPGLFALCGNICSPWVAISVCFPLIMGRCKCQAGSGCCNPVAHTPYQIRDTLVGCPNPATGSSGESALWFFR